MMSSFARLLFLVTLTFGLSACFKSAEERAADHYENGMQLVEAGDLPRAIVEFRNTIKFDENNIDAYRQMARAHYALGMMPDAYAGFLRLVEQSPDDLEGRITLSTIAFEKQSWEEFDRHSSYLGQIETDDPAAAAVAIGAAYRQASLENDRPRQDAIITQAESLAETLPDNHILQRIRVDAYIARGTFEAAIEVLDRNIATEPENVALYYTKLQLLGRLNKETQIETTLRQMLGIFPENQTIKETFLAFLLARDRTQEAEDYMESYLATATPENLNGAFLSLITFLRDTKGDEAALARVDAGLSGSQAENQMWQVLRASLIFEMGNPEDAIAAIGAVLDTKPVTLPLGDYLNVRTTLARMLLLTGDQQAGRAIVEDVLTQDPGLPNALKLRATWLIQDDETSAAINDLRRALESAPEDADAMVLMANAYQRAGNRDLEQDFLARAAEASNSAPRYALLSARALLEDGKPLQAENVLIASLRMVPNQIELLTTLGQIYLQLDDMARTEQVARALANIGSDAARATAQSLQAELIVRRLGVDDALKFLEQQTSESGDEITAALTMIEARLKTGRNEDALRTAQQAVAANPDDPRLRNALSLSYASVGNLDAAETELRDLLDRFPDATELYLRLARISAAKGDPAAGAATIDTALARQPASVDLLWAKASYLERDGDIDGAIQIYENLYERDSNSMIIANNLASLLATYRNDPESLELAATIARRLNGSKIPALQDTYGYIQFRRGNLQDALTNLEPAAAGLPSDPMVQFHLGQTYAALDRPEDALARMQAALVVAGPLADPDFRDLVVSEMNRIEAAMTSE